MNTAAVWSLSGNDMLDDDMDIMDSDDLLDAEDLKKPDPASLKGKCIPRIRATHFQKVKIKNSFIIL